jgi:hypothetical protein
MKIDLSTKDIAAIYKCKHCGHTKRIAYKVEIRRIDNEHPDWYLHKRWTTYTIIEPDPRQCFFKGMKELRFPALTCDCGSHVFGKRIEGHVNESVPCDRRCTHAKGHSCECSCGGANHGLVYA